MHTLPIARWLACATLAACSQIPAQAAVDPTDVAALLGSLPESGDVGASLKSVTQDMPISTPSASVLLGAADTQVPRVSTFRDAALTLSSGLGKDGKIKQAVGFEVLPATALRELQWRELNSPWMKAWARTSVSFATSPDDAAGSARTAFGVQTVLYSREADAAVRAIGQDSCTKIMRDAMAKPPPPPGPGQPLPMFTDEEQAQLAACDLLIRKTLNKWNPTTLAVGAGQAYYAADAKPSSLSSAASSWWVTGAWGLDFRRGGTADAAADTGLALTGHWRQSRDERAADLANPDGVVPESSRLWALNLRVGSVRAALVAEASGRRSQIAGLPDEDRRRAFLGGELRVAKGLYFALGVAGDRGARDGTSQQMVLGNLKWGFGDQPVLPVR